MRELRQLHSVKLYSMFNFARSLVRLVGPKRKMATAIQKYRERRALCRDNNNGTIEESTPTPLANKQPQQQDLTPTARDVYKSMHDKIKVRQIMFAQTYFTT